MRFNFLLIIALLFSAASTTSASVSQLRPYLNKNICELDTLDIIKPAKKKPAKVPSILIDRVDFDSLLSANVSAEPLPRGKYAPIVYGRYQIIDTLPMTVSQIHNPLFADSYSWLDDYDSSDRLFGETRQRFEISNPGYVRYNSEFMPEVPKQYRAYVDKVTTRIVFEEMKVDDSTLKNMNTDIEHKRWLHSFDASMQFSQAYISPNWYQGGNNNLNLIGQFIYNVKLNQKFYPKYLFEATLSYKLALNNAPDDSIHTINITEDILQFNATMGYKAARRWYYSANILFKTQLFNSYPTNSHDLRAAFMSPGELNVGLGMTYSYQNPKKTLSFGASISPLSWNLKTVRDHSIPPSNYGIDNGRRVKNKVGSSAECTLEWKIAYNIMYHSRLFLFTDYDYAYADWEHTIDFNINRFLTTRLYAHMRYDTSTPPTPDSSWKKFQFKEIFSFGFAYHFSTI